MEAFKTEIINDKGDIEEISIKTEIERQNFMTSHNYRDFKDINDFKEESKYLKNQEKKNERRYKKDFVHSLFEKEGFCHFFVKREWQPRRKWN